MLTQSGRFTPARCTRKNLAGFEQDFRFTRQNGFAGPPRKERHADATTKPTYKKENIHETHTNPARNASLSDA
jgi:hypothetical protein